MSEIPEQSSGLFERADAAKPPPAPKPNAEWKLPGGTARVYLGQGNTALQRPVILSDGFNSGPSDFDAFWHGLNGLDFAFVDKLRERGHDLILLGYNERSASILQNAEAATACIMQAIAERMSDSPMLVGGFSMGGLITRYALARMEAQRMDHQTGVYLSFDSPHRGASIPLALQALAHFLTGFPAMSRQINSPASRQLLWQHIESVEATPQQDPLRTEFLAALQRVGDWPMRPMKLAVANGRGDGQGNGVPAGAIALECTQGAFKPTTLRTQSPDNRVVLAHLKGPLQEKEVRARGLPAIDGAPGGLLESFGIAADNLTKPLLGLQAVAHHRSICFVPTISAVSSRDINEENLNAKVDELDRETSDLDDFICSSDNTLHSKMTVELGNWVLERLPH